MARAVLAAFCGWRWPLRLLVVTATGAASILEEAIPVAGPPRVDVLLQLEALEAPGAAAAAGMQVAFYVGGAWTEDETLAVEAPKGLLVEKRVVLPSWPTRVRLAPARQGAEQAPRLRRAELLRPPSLRPLPLLGPCTGKDCMDQPGPARPASGGAHGIYRVPPLRCAEEAGGPGCRGDGLAVVADRSASLRGAGPGLDAAGRASGFPEELLALAAPCSNYTCPGGTHALNLTCRSGRCSAAVCCGPAAAPSRTLAAGEAARASCELSLGELGWGVPCWDVDTGMGFVMYSAEALASRFPQHAPQPGAAEHLACVRFRAGAWQYSSSRLWHGFRARPSDVLVAEVDFRRGAAELLAGERDDYEGVPKGYRLGNVQLSAESWRGSPGGGGRFAVSGQYISSEGCQGSRPPRDREPSTSTASCEIVAGISCHLQRPMVILSAVIIGACLLCCLYKLCQVTLSKHKKLPASSARTDSGSAKGGSAHEVVLEVDGVVASERRVPKDYAENPLEDSANFGMFSDEEQKRVQELWQVMGQPRPQLEPTLLQDVWHERSSVAPSVESTCLPVKAYLGDPPATLIGAAEAEEGVLTFESRPALVLQVATPNAQEACSGEYALIHDEGAHGTPVWKMRGGSRWLYCGLDGKWYIGGVLSKRHDFRCSSGFICSSQPHQGRMPDCVTDTWEVGDGEQWTQDPDIIVTELVPAPAVPAEQATRQRQASHRPSSEEDSPGMYIVIHKEAAVTSGLRPAPPILAHLGAGTAIRVLEVVRCIRERRVRGRLESPPGWITLCGLDGYRWAQRVQVCTEDHVESVSLYKKQAQLMSANFPAAAKQSKDLSDYSTEQGSTASGTSDGKSRSLGLEPASPLGDGNSSCGGSVAGTLPESVCDQPAAVQQQRQSSAAEASQACEDEHASARPQVLCVRSPNGQFVCAGIYDLDPQVMPNGMPLWKQRGGQHWIYSAKAQRWCVGGQDVIDRNFDTNSGWIYQGQQHGGVPPHRCPGPWLRWAGNGFEVDPGIEIVVESAAPERRSKKDREAPHQARDGCPKTKWDSTAPAAVSLKLEDDGRGSHLEVALECIHAGGVDTSALGLHQRCILQSLEAGAPWAVGPLRQPEIFHGLVCAGASGFEQDLFELCWRPPYIHLLQPCQNSLLLLNGQVLQNQSAMLEHGSEVSACARGAEQALPVFTFRVLRERSAVGALKGTLQAAQAEARGESQALGRSILDLRGSRLSREERRAMSNFKEEALRIVI